ncbi:MAG: hypothetical protein RLY31_2849 [Bacteroidota bacterium]|jgi:argininosuccinate lyase
MKLWSKESSVHALVEAFTVGQDPVLDLSLAEFDILGTLAHIEMLTAVGLLEPSELPPLRSALADLYEEAKAGRFRIEPGVEDIHSQVELLLTRRLGDIGKKIHSGRSRNDQVLVDLRLFFRAEIQRLVELTGQLVEVLLHRSEESKDILMPGYTHTQVAMVSSFGLWFGAWAETLVDDLRLLSAVFRTINQNPLGSAAGYGSSFPLDRVLTTRLLGFDDLNYNVVHAQLGRGKTEQFLSFGVAALASTLGRLANDICWFNSQNFQFLRLPAAFTTGSSIMPHKRNPDVFELIRSRCNLLQTLPQQVAAVSGNLLSGYHRDFQLLKEVLFPATARLQECLRLCLLCVPEMTLGRDLLSDEKYRYLFTVEEVNRLVLEGLPFRDAYLAVSEAVREGRFSFQGEIRHTHAGSLGNLGTADIRRKFREVQGQFDFKGSIGKALALVERP